jgi:hypothetical protein
LPEQPRHDGARWPSLSRGAALRGGWDVTRQEQVAGTPRTRRQDDLSYERIGNKP